MERPTHNAGGLVLWLEEVRRQTDAPMVHSASEGLCQTGWAPMAHM